MGNCQKDEIDLRELGNGKGPVLYLRVTNYVWNKDYEGLFDYDSSKIEEKSFQVKGNCTVGKGGGHYEFMPDDLKLLTQSQIQQSVFRIEQKDNHFQINPIVLENWNQTLKKLLWLVVSSLPDKRHIIQERDVLKLGKQKMRVREIVHADQNPSTILKDFKLSKVVYDNLKSGRAPEKNEQEPEKQAIKENFSQITTSEQLCRICFDPGNYSDPLIAPCKCSGSVKHIHLKCLKSWLAKKLKVGQSQHCITINWETLSCEMCKFAFKYRIYMDGKKFYTVDIPKPPKPYIVLELVRKKTSSKGKIFHFITFATKNKITLGRRKDVDARVSEDISISRAHAFIEYDPDSKELRLIDNKSKFGTLILIRKGLVVRPKFAGISFQLGPQVFSFQALRGPGNENFQPDEGSSEYLLDYLSDQEDEDAESEHENQSSNQGSIIQQQLQQIPELQMRNRQSSLQPE